MASDTSWRFDKNRAALLVIDMQRDFVEAGAIMEVPMARNRIPEMRRILERCRTDGVPVFFTRHVLSDRFDISPLETTYIPKLKSAGMREGTPGAEVIAELTPRPDETVIVKHRYDAFYNTQLDTALRNVRGPGGVDTVIVVGTVTNICCESTARSAFMRDYKVAFISDANGGLDDASHNATLEIIGKVFGRVMTTDELLAELQGQMEQV
jgi:ureidoacrylate peracid hydrolase